MICWIHQPNYLPWLGYFHKIALSDVFVFYDTTQYTKGDYRNRNTIKGSNGPIQLTLPVSFSLWQTIAEVTFQKKILWKHLKTILQAYAKAPYFDEYKDALTEIYSFTWDNLSEFNIYMTRKICELLWIETKFIVLSETDFDLQSQSTQALIDICKYVWANKYVVGWDAGYMDNDLIIENDIELVYQNFTHPSYDQLWWDFEPYMSIIDLLFNQWPNSKKILLSAA